MPHARLGDFKRPIERRLGSELPFRKKCANMGRETGLILQIGQ